MKLKFIVCVICLLAGAALILMKMYVEGELAIIIGMLFDLGNAVSICMMYIVRTYALQELNYHDRKDTE